MARPKNPVLADKTERIDARVSPATRQALEDAAAARGISLSREIEDRLTRTLADDGADGDGEDRETAALLWGLRLVISRVQELTNTQWQSDGFTRDVLADAARSFILFLGPDVDGAPSPPGFPATVPDEMGLLKRDTAEQLIKHGVGRYAATLVKRAMAMPSPESDWGRFFERTYSGERTIAQRLHGLMRVRFTDENEGVLENGQ